MALATFLLIALSGPALVRWYVSVAVDHQTASAQVVDGVFLVQRQGQRDWVAAGDGSALGPGDALRTPEDSRAFVRLFDHSTLLLYPSTTIRLLRLEQGRYKPERKTSVLRLESGKVRVGVAPPEQELARPFFQVRTPHAEIHLEDGSYTVEATPDETHVVTRVGRATAWADQQYAAAAPGQRVAILSGQPPQPPVAAVRDLLVNGEFLVSQADRGLPYRWQHYDASEVDPPGAIEMDRDAQGPYVRITRAGLGHGETVLRQEVMRDISDYQRAVLSAEVKVDRHNLSGGGWAGSEYPLMLRVVYRDAARGYTTWYHGFYAQNEDGLSVRDASRVPAGTWVQRAFDLRQLVPTPVFLVRVEVLGAGWSYDSGIRNLRLLAE